MALVDTGATHTCIDLDLARSLDLPEREPVLVYGSAGGHQNKRFDACVWVLWEKGRPLRLNARMQAVPDVMRTCPDFVSLGTDRPPLIALLGRDFLTQVVMTYDGISGRVTFAVKK